MDRRDYWKRVAAPKLRERKEILGREFSNTIIGAAIETATGKSSGRQLVEAWFKGDREPYISQFFALCDYLKLHPGEVLEISAVQSASPMPQGAQVHVYKKGRLAKERWNESGRVSVLRSEVGSHAGVQGKRRIRRPRKGSGGASRQG